MAGENEQGSDQGGPPQSGSPVTMGMLTDLRREVLEAIGLAIAAVRGELATPVTQVVQPLGVGENAPVLRASREAAAEGVRRDLAGRELFPVPASSYPASQAEASQVEAFPASANPASAIPIREAPVHELVGRVEEARAASGGSPFCELVLSAPLPEGIREPDMQHYPGSNTCNGSRTPWGAGI